MSEVLLSYNSTSHIQKMECDAPETHNISWNSVPVCKVVCAFPYILAFTPVAIEFRYAVNGSLLQTLTMPELRLISAKVSLSGNKLIAYIFLLYIKPKLLRLIYTQTLRNSTFNM